MEPLPRSDRGPGAPSVLNVVSMDEPSAHLDGVLLSSSVQRAVAQLDSILLGGAPACAPGTRTLPAG